jgi:hypothetical protein
MAPQPAALCPHRSQAEEMRQRVAADVGAHAVAEVDRAGVSGTAAAFEGGRDPEPHQGMEYTASLPTGAALCALPLSPWRPAVLCGPGA